ncbi:MAG: Fic family protein, partial [Streptomyces sp.]|nr:Fic family protein [Streptomyces sp.]
MVRDDLGIWQMVREEVPWARAAPDLTYPVHAVRDGITAAVAARGLAHDPSRTERFQAAWHLAQEHANTARALDLHLLRRWQQVVLGHADVPFRTGPAFAKRGQERYGLSDRTEADFAECIAQATATGTGIPLPARAARAYLDVCFFHPFSDGNGRSALLALGFVLAREHVFLDEARPLQVRRFPHDA